MSSVFTEELMIDSVLLDDIVCKIKKTTSDAYKQTFTTGSLKEIFYLFLSMDNTNLLFSLFILDELISMFWIQMQFVMRLL